MNKSFLQSTGWAKFQESMGRECKNINGTHVLFQTAPVINKKYAYVPYCDAPTSNILDEIKKGNVIFIRVEPIEPFDTTGFKKVHNIQPAKSLVLNLEKTEEELLAGMHPKTRYNIGVAKRHGVEVGAAGQQEQENVLKLIVETASRQGYKSHDLSYYKSMVDFFNNKNGDDFPKIVVMQASYQSKLLAGGIYIDYGDTRTYLFGGTISEYKNVMSPHILHWQAINDAKNAGLKKYDFWGIETAKGDTPGFVRFKLGFGGDTVEYPGAYDLIVNPFWYNIYTILRRINQLINGK